MNSSDFQIERLSLQTLDRLANVARRLFNEEEKPGAKMLFAAALRGIREEIKSRQVEHHDLKVTNPEPDWEGRYNSLLKK
jgi:hypothetical protein